MLKRSGYGKFEKAHTETHTINMLLTLISGNLLLNDES